MTLIRRRELLATGAATAGLLALGPNFWRAAFAAPATVGPGPYGPLQAADANGLQLPAGFTSRLVARGREAVAGTDYVWHTDSDGQATFAEADGGWVLVSNSEIVSTLGGGCSSIRFAPDGAIRGAQRIASTNLNCAGGPAPWGSWLTCEEFAGGLVWECDPLGRFPAQSRPAMGTFTHEAVTVDPVGQRLYMTEDKGDGCFYRFTPTVYPDLRAGRLEVAIVGAGGATTWATVPDPAGIGAPTRQQVAGAATFKGGEGIWCDSGVVYFTTKGDHRLWAYDTTTAVLDTLYDPAQGGDSAFLTGPDNLTVSRAGDLFVCEDNGAAQFDIVMVTPDRTLSSFLRSSGPIHAGSEFSGVTFSPDGSRMYFSSQRAYMMLGGGLLRAGAVYEVSGPFRAARPGWGGAPPVTDAAPLVNPPGAPPVEPPPATSPIPAPPSVEDVDAPRLRLTAPGRVSLARLRAEGLLVTIRTDEASALTATLRTSALGVDPGKRGSAPRPKLVTLDTRSVQAAGAGSLKVRLRLSASEARRVERALAKARRKRSSASIALRLTVQGRDAHANVSIANRKIAVTAPLRAAKKTSRG